MPTREVIRGARVVTDAGIERADVALTDGRISEIGQVSSRPDDTVTDAADRLLLPGMIDAHCHADATVFDPEVQQAFLRQGVTTVVTGQDGVSFAPGDGRYATEYFAGLNGRHPTFTGGSVAELLATYTNTTPLNVAYLVPLGTVRHNLLGYCDRQATAEELAQLTAQVRAGLADGAVGVSTGLDYVPGIHSDTHELTELCRPVADAGSLYVTHMRGGYEMYAKIGTDEVAAIARDAAVAVHISHYHGDADLLVGLIDNMRAAQLDVTYDAYLYRRGCSLVSMPILPADLLTQGKRQAAQQLREATVRTRLLREWFPHLAKVSPLGPRWAELISFAHLPAREYDWAHGLTVSQAGARTGADPAEFVLDVLAATDLDATCVMRVRTERTHDQMLALFTHPAFTGGSDGISIGKHPHPRAYGAFSRFLRELVLEHGVWSWPDAVRHLATLPAQRFGLSGHGRIERGAAADVCLVDPDTVADRATYEDPRALAVGIDDVWVAGQSVLRNGNLTGVHSGRALRRTHRLG